MRILVVASYNKGYYAPFIIEQAKAIEDKGHKVVFFGIQGKGFLGYMFNYFKLKKVIKTFSPQIIHAHYGLSGLLANLQRKIPVVTTFHGSDINNKKGDMYVIVDVVMPSKLTKKQKDLFKELSETTLDDDSKFTKFNKMLKK